jgi:hypothetical protein
MRTTLPPERVQPMAADPASRAEASCIAASCIEASCIEASRPCWLPWIRLPSSPFVS